MVILVRWLIWKPVLQRSSVGVRVVNLCMIMQLINSEAEMLTQNT